MSDLLSPLQIEAAELLARGESPTAVRSQLELPQTTFAMWREDEDFDEFVRAERARLAAEGDQATDTKPASTLKATARAAFRKSRATK